MYFELDENKDTKIQEMQIKQFLGKFIAPNILQKKKGLKQVISALILNQNKKEAQSKQKKANKDQNPRKNKRSKWKPMKWKQKTSKGNQWKPS